MFNRIKTVKITPNSFLLVYSNFKYKTTEGDFRKAIIVREVTINLNDYYSILST
jgi:hypothetical protein